MADGGTLDDSFVDTSGGDNLKTSRKTTQEGRRRGPRDNILKPKVKQLLHSIQQNSYFLIFCYFKWSYCIQYLLSMFNCSSESLVGILGIGFCKMSLPRSNAFSNVLNTTKIKMWVDDLKCMCILHFVCELKLLCRMKFACLKCCKLHINYHISYSTHPSGQMSAGKEYSWSL